MSIEPVTVPTVTHAVEQLAAGQRGIVTRAQLLALGVPDVSIYRRVHRGAWQRLLPGTYAVFSGEPTAQQRRLAAMLYAGENAQLTGPPALRHYGFRYGPPDDRVFVLVPHGTRRKSINFAQIRRTLELDADARPTTDGYMICSPVRALVDTCRDLTDFRMVRALVAEAVQRRFASLGVLDATVRRAGRSRTALVRRAAEEVIAGARSAPEAELKTTLDGSRLLPKVQWNVPLWDQDGTRLPTPDGWIGEVGLAIEVDSREYHLSPEDWQRSLQRHNQLARYGVMVLHFTPGEIRDRPLEVRKAVEDAYLARKADGTATTVKAGAPS